MTTVGARRFVSLLVLLLVAVSMAGCAAVAGVFKAGVWVGVIIAVILIAAAIALFSRLS
jgi:hypothetical protein